MNYARIDGVTPIVLAAQEGHHRLVKVLIDAGAEVDVEIQGYTPLYIACQQGHEKVVRELLLGGADPNIAVKRTGKKSLGDSSHFAIFLGLIRNYV